MPVKSRQSDIVVQDFENETLIYDLKTNKAYLLNETSAFVWNACDGKTDISVIGKALAQKFKAAANDELVWLAIDQLRHDGLMQETVEPPKSFIETNRREVIKQIGLATMIALPLISSLAAPKAANAASLTCSLVVGQCYSPRLPACPADCIASGARFRSTVYQSTDGSCTTAQWDILSTLCEAGSGFSLDFKIQSIF